MRRMNLQRGKLPWRRSELRDVEQDGSGREKVNAIAWVGGGTCTDLMGNGRKPRRRERPRVVLDSSGSKREPEERASGDAGSPRQEGGVPRNGLAERLDDRRAAVAPQRDALTSVRMKT